MTNSSASLPMREAEVSVVAVVDYGSGNLHSARKAFERAARSSGTGQTIIVTSDPQAIRDAERIVLPGVGAFADCRRGLAAIPGMVETLEEMVIARGRPFLGICVGMQLMASRGLEHATTEGLGWIPGDVTAIRPSDPRLEDSAHGMEHSEGRAASGVRSIFRPAKAAGMAISCILSSFSR